MKTRLLLALSILLFGLSSFGQIVCGFDEVHRQKLQNDPIYRKNVEETEKSVRQYIAKHKTSLTVKTNGINSVVYTIPIVVHVMHTGGSVGTIYNPSDIQIQNAITYLNQVFNGTYLGTEGVGDIQVQFALAVKDPNCNSTTAINRTDASALGDYTTNGIRSATANPGVDELDVKNLSRWNSTHYYNIWVVNKIDGKDGTSGSFTAGYAYFPGAPQPYDGTVMLATQMNSGQKTLPHEIGHAFGLYHTFEGSADKNNCPVNTDCSVNGDRVCDTDPVTYNYVSGVTDFSCRTGTNTCTTTPYNSNTEKNYMNYTTCYTLFTAGQKARMLAFAASAWRKSLTTSMALNSSYPIASFSNPAPATCAPSTGTDGLAANYAGIINIDVNNKSLGSSSARNDNGYLDGTGSCLNLIQLTRGASYTFSATTIGNNTEQVRAWIDYNNDGVFDNLTEEILFKDNVPTNASTTSNPFTVPTTAKLNTMLRMRVIDELSYLVYGGILPISSGCFNPQYGQAEDYPVYITNGALPVTLVKFEGALKNGAAFLTWQTGSSQGLKNFELEKSTDGVFFEKMATVMAVPQNRSTGYTYVDAQVNVTNYYRLRMYEENGSAHVSEVVVVRFNESNQRMWVVNNPFINYLDLRFVNPATTVTLQLLNTSGSVVAQKTMRSVQRTERWHLPGAIARGTYVVKVQIGNEMFINKVVKQ